MLNWPLSRRLFLLAAALVLLLLALIRLGGSLRVGIRGYRETQTQLTRVSQRHRLLAEQEALLRALPQRVGPVGSSENRSASNFASEITQLADSIGTRVISLPQRQVADATRETDERGAPLLVFALEGTFSELLQVIHHLEQRGEYVETLRLIREESRALSGDVERYLVAEVGVRW